MSNLKTPPNVFLQSIELNRLKRFLDDDGFRLFFQQNLKTPGIVRYLDDNLFNYFKASKQIVLGTEKLFINDGYAVCKNANIIALTQQSDAIDIPQGSFYWVKIKHVYSSIEPGTVAIDGQGALTGINCSFLSTLRGGPDFPSRIKLTNSVQNTQEYDVISVIDDNNAILQGSTFFSENNLKYSVVGTFTRGISIPLNDKYIFQYDAVEIELVEETEDNQKPSIIDVGNEFFIARVYNNAGTLLIEDKRSDFWSITQELINFFTEKSVLFGIERVSFQNSASTRVDNIVEVAWGFSSNNYTYDPSVNKLTLTDGKGGKYKSPAYFNNNDFNGWRVYWVDQHFDEGDRLDLSSYSTISNSQKNGSNIELSLLEGDPDLFIYNKRYSNSVTYLKNQKVSQGSVIYRSRTDGNLGNALSNSDFWQIIIPTIVVVPNVDHVEIKCSSSYLEWQISTTYSIGSKVYYNGVLYVSQINNNIGIPPLDTAIEWSQSSLTSEELSTKVFNFNFPIASGRAKLNVLCYDSLSYYNVQYRFSKQGQFTEWYIVASDDNISDANAGYYNEVNTKVKYTADIAAAFLILTRAADSYTDFKDKIDTSDLFGVEYIADIESFIGTGGSRITGRTFNIKVGETKQNIEVDGLFATTLTSTINFNFLNTAAKSGSSFWLFFKGSGTKTFLNNNNNNTIKIVIQKNGSDHITLTQDELNKGNILFHCEYDQSSGWQILKHDVDYNGDGVFLKGEEVVDFSKSVLSGGNFYVKISGYYKNVVLYDAAGNVFNSIAGIIIQNGKFINDLNIIFRKNNNQTYLDLDRTGSTDVSLHRYSLYFDTITVTEPVAGNINQADGTNVYSTSLDAKDNILPSAFSITDPNSKIEDQEIKQFTLATANNTFQLVTYKPILVEKKFGSKNFSKAVGNNNSYSFFKIFNLLDTALYLGDDPDDDITIVAFAKSISIQAPRKTNISGRITGVCAFGTSGNFENDDYVAVPFYVSKTLLKPTVQNDLEYYTILCSVISDMHQSTSGANFLPATSLIVSPVTWNNANILNELMKLDRAFTIDHSFNIKGMDANTPHYFVMQKSGIDGDDSYIDMLFMKYSFEVQLV